MNKPLFLFVGKSASGKTTIANLLEEKYCFNQVQSYTTRKPRYDGETGHIFLTEDEFNELEDIVSYTLYNDNQYGTTASLLDKNNIFVVDVPGVESLLQKYKTDRPICIIYFDTTVATRIRRMVNRNDSDMAIIARLLQDEENDWFKQLDSLVWHYNHIVGRNVELYSVNANNDQSNVLKMVLYYINRHMED
jgi:guanylate kinase